MLCKPLNELFFPIQEKFTKNRTLPIHNHDPFKVSGITTDRSGNVLLCASRANKVFAITSGGTPMCAVDCEVNLILKFKTTFAVTSPGA